MTTVVKLSCKENSVQYVKVDVVTPNGKIVDSFTLGQDERTVSLYAGRQIVLMEIAESEG